MSEYILLYKDQARHVRTIYQNMKAETPADSNGALGINAQRLSYAKNPGLRTPQGSKPFIKAFTASTPLQESYQAKHV